MSKISYGAKSRVEDAIRTGVIPKDTLIITDDIQDPELLFYNKDGVLRAVSERTKFDSLSDAEQWIRTYDCIGNIFSIQINGAWELYLVQENNTLCPCTTGSSSATVSQASHYEGIKSNGETDTEVIARVLSASDASPQREDIFVVKTKITDGKYAYTAYVFDGKKWMAMDGNYSAENVYFPSNMTITAPVGVYTQDMINKNNGSIIHETEGKNLLEGFTSLFAEVKDPTITQPSVSMSASATPASAEIGSKITKLSWNGNFSGGSYEYGSKADNTRYTDTSTGVTIKNWTISNDINKQTSSLEDGSFTLATEDYITIDSTSKKTYATISWSATYSDSPRTPVNNIGGEVEGKIIGATKSGTASVSATGYRSSFYYLGNDCVSSIDSAFVRAAISRNASTKNFNLDTYTKDGKTKCLTIPGGTKRIMLAVHSSATLAEVKDLDGMGLDVKGNFVTKTVEVEGANGFDADSYTIFDCVNENGIAATNYVITIT